MLTRCNDCTGKRTAFEQYEAQLYEDLGNIISEAGVFHGALDKALQLEIEAFQRGLGPISSTTARLEAPPAPVTIAAPVTSGVAPTTAVPATTVAPTTAVAAPVAAKPGETTTSSLPLLDITLYCF